MGGGSERAVFLFFHLKIKYPSLKFLEAPRFVEAREQRKRCLQRAIRLAIRLSHRIRLGLS